MGFLLWIFSSNLPLSNKVKVEKVLKSGIQNGNYVITKVKPLITSALGCVPKGESSVRLIHDASMPTKFCIDNFVDEKSCSYMDLKVACNLIKPNSYLCKVDLKNAYRTVCIHKSNFSLTGLHWKFEEIQILHIFMIPSFLVELQNHLEPVWLNELGRWI